MKKIIFVFVVSLSIAFLGCKSEEKKEETKEVSKSEEKKSTAAFAVANASNIISFTAYKTTEKVPVVGEFKKVKIITGGEGNTVKEAINGTAFSVPISSLATKDASRDLKIKTYFFEKMVGTDALTGYFQINDDTSGVVKLTMNDVAKDVPFTYTIVDKTFTMQATIDINDWNASAALASLNKVCEVLHTGADGVSKTWSEVALNITSTFQ